MIEEETALNPKYDRESNASRSGNEIGVSLIKGGNMQPTHEVLYCGENEILTISHTELSANQFAKGAYDAALWLLTKSTGLYSMEEYIADKLNNK